MKVAKQAYDIMPTMIKAGGDGMVDGGILSGVGFPADRRLVLHASHT